MPQRPRARYRNVLNEALSCYPSSQNTSLAKVSTHTLSVQESNVSYPIALQENSQGLGGTKTQRSKRRLSKGNPPKNLQAFLLSVLDLSGSRLNNRCIHKQSPLN